MRVGLACREGYCIPRLHFRSCITIVSQQEQQQHLHYHEFNVWLNPSTVREGSTHDADPVRIYIFTTVLGVINTPEDNYFAFGFINRGGFV